MRSFNLETMKSNKMLTVGLVSILALAIFFMPVFGVIDTNWISDGDAGKGDGPLIIGNQTSIPSETEYTPGQNFGFELNATNSTWDVVDGDPNRIGNVTFETNLSGTWTNYTLISTPALVNDTAGIYYINFTQEQIKGAYCFQYQWIVNSTVNGAQSYNATGNSSGGAGSGNAAFCIDKNTTWFGSSANASRIFDFELINGTSWANISNEAHNYYYPNSSSNISIYNRTGTFATYLLTNQYNQTNLNWTLSKNITASTFETIKTLSTNNMSSNISYNKTLPAGLNLLNLYTAGNENYSSGNLTHNITILLNESNNFLTLKINGTSANDAGEIYPAAINATCVFDTSDVSDTNTIVPTIYTNNTSSIATGTWSTQAESNKIAAAGATNFSCNLTSQNFSTESTMYNVSITKGVLMFDLFLNGIQNTDTEDYWSDITSINASGAPAENITNGVADWNFQILREAENATNTTSVGTTSPISNIWTGFSVRSYTYNLNASTNVGQNYTSNTTGVSAIFTVKQYPPVGGGGLSPSGGTSDSGNLGIPAEQPTTSGIGADLTSSPSDLGESGETSNMWIPVAGIIGIVAIGAAWKFGVLSAFKNAIGGLKEKLGF